MCFKAKKIPPVELLREIMFKHFYGVLFHPVACAPLTRKWFFGAKREGGKKEKRCNFCAGEERRKEGGAKKAT